MGKGSEYTVLQERFAMANKHTERCSTLSVIEEMQIKTADEIPLDSLLRDGYHEHHR